MDLINKIVPGSLKGLPGIFKSQNRNDWTEIIQIPTGERQYLVRKAHFLVLKDTSRRLIVYD